MAKRKPVVFHNGSKYDHHFITKELAEKIYHLYSSNRKRSYKNLKKWRKDIYYILQFIDSARFMVSSLSNLINSLSEGIYRIKCKFGHDYKKCEANGIRYKYCNCFLEYAIFKDDLIEYKCLCCNKNNQHKFDEILKE